MSKRTICTCDLCGKDIEPVEPIRLMFGRVSYPAAMLYPHYRDIGLEEMRGDACNTCLRKLIEELRSRLLLKYEVRG